MTGAPSHALAMKYEYARLALASATRFLDTARRDPSWFADLWRARGAEPGPAPVVTVEAGDVVVVAFPPSDAPQACLFVAVSGTRVFALERPNATFEAPADGAVLVELDGRGRLHHGVVRAADPPAVARVLRAM